MVNDTDIKVGEYLKENGITVQVFFTGATTRDAWECDSWSVVFNRKQRSGINDKGPWSTPGVSKQFDYYTGTGHRSDNTVNIRRRLGDALPGNTQPLIHPVKGVPGHRRLNAVAPTAACVIYSLLLDATCHDETFESWCDNYGYDTDSRKALDMYLACQETYNKLCNLFTGDQREHLQELLEDY